MTHTAHAKSLFVMVCAAIALGLTPLMSGAQAAPPPRAPRPPQGDTTALLQPPSSTDPPAMHRPTSVPAAMRTLSPPTVLPPAPGGAPLDTTAGRGRQPAGTGGAGAAIQASTAPVGASAPAIPAPLTRVAPVPRVRAQQAVVRVVDATQSRPNGASMRCKDGSYLNGAPLADRCDNRGGVALLYRDEQAPARRP